MVQRGEGRGVSLLRALRIRQTGHFKNILAANWCVLTYWQLLARVQTTKLLHASVSFSMCKTYGTQTNAQEPGSELCSHQV